MQIGVLNLYKGVEGTIEVGGNGYCGRCKIGDASIKYAADTVEDLSEEFHKVVDKYYNSPDNVANN